MADNKKHTLRILGPEGDIKHEWGDAKSPEAQKAGEAFDQKIGSHLAVADGQPTRAFDADKNETTMFPRMQAGSN